MITIGITGSIGMGKTTVAHMMREKSIPVHDSDASVHYLLGPEGAAVLAVGRLFPDALAEDENKKSYIDRKILGKIVFADYKKKKILENILHPMVRAESDAFKDEMKKRGHKLAALDIPLLFETGGETRVDVTICVSAPPETQRTRVLARPGMTAEKFDRVVAGQMPDAEKRKRADYVVETGVSLENTRAQVERIVEELLARAGHKKEKSGA